MSWIIRSSATRSWLASALAAADSISLRMSRAAPREEKRRSASASSIGSPRTWSATRRAFRGARRTKRALALTTGRSGASFGCGLGLASAFALVSALGFAGAFAFVSAFGFASPFGLAWVAGFFAGAFGFAAAGFFAGGFLAAGFCCLVSFFSSAITLAP